MGREFKTVTLQYFPYINYTQQETKSPQLQDSLDYRILTEVAQHFNFTYVYGFTAKCNVVLLLITTNLCINSEALFV